MIKNKGGRPRTFDEDTALDAAVEVFWRHGYEGTSLPALTGAMGMNRPSLYGTFGDKHRLFLRALDRYRDGIGSEPLEAFEREEDPKAAVRAFLRKSVENNTRPNGAPGCLIACCAATSVQDLAGVGERLTAVFSETEARLTVRFEAMAAAGVLLGDPPPSIRARRLVDMMNAQAVRARAGTTRQALLDDLMSARHLFSRDFGLTARSGASVFVGGSIPFC